LSALIAMSFALCSLTAHAAPAAEVANGAVTVSAVPGDGGGFVGFRLADANGEVTVVHFGSMDSIRAAKVEKSADSLKFTGLTANPTPTLGPDSAITVRLLKGDAFPEVDFRLDLTRFDQNAWEAVNGTVPFHFLVCAMPGAEVFYQRGWPIGTPVVDEYPIHGMKGGGRTIGSRWSQEWSYAPPIGAYPMPDVGLWGKSARTFVCYDFNGARLTDHSEKYVASAYAYKHRDTGQFFCLVWPFAKAYQDLRYPGDPTYGKLPATVASHFRLLYSRSIGGDDDPSLFIQQWMWATYRDLLPGAPTMNNLSWLPGGCRPASFGAPSLGKLYGTEANPVFFTPGAVMANGIGYDPNSAVDYAYRQGRQGEIGQLKADIDYLLPYATRQTIDGDDCVYWRYPITGDGAKMFGPGVPSLHSSWGWGVGLALLDTWRNDRDAEARLLPYIDGVLRFTKHILYTRNDYPDVPAAEFAWGAGPACTFCLRYYYTFRDDPQRKDLADLAYKLSRSMLYRFMAIWPSDNDNMDNLDSSFLMEPNAGFPWLGAACSNEVWVYTFAMAEMYAATGDPIVGHYLRGQLDAWHALYKDTFAPTMTAYSTDALTERLGFFDEAAQPRGTRADYGGIWGGTENLIWPVGSSVARVLCGEKAAMAFDKDGLHTDIADYRYYGNGNLSFRLVRGDKTPVALTVTFPFFELKGKPVRIVSGEGGASRTLTGEESLRTWDTRPDSIQVSGVIGGDTVVVGDTYDPTVAPLKCEIEKPRTLMQDRVIKSAPGFTTLNLSHDARTQTKCDWSDPKSYAGLDCGMRDIYGVPFYIIPPELNGGRSAIRDEGVATGLKGEYLFALVGRQDARSKLRVVYADGKQEDAPLAQSVPVMRGWPPLLEWEINMVTIHTGGREVATIVPQNVDLFSLTACQRNETQMQPTFLALKDLQTQITAERAAIKKLVDMRPLFERFSGHIALLTTPPPDGSRGQVAKMLQKADLMRFVTVISPTEMGMPAAFNAGKFWVTLYCGGEDYAASAADQEAFDTGMQRYLAGGGTLIALPTMPFPFYYAANKPVVSAAKFGLPICGSGAEKRPDKIEEAGVVGWEKPPAGKTLTFKLDPQQSFIAGIPPAFPFPSAASGLDPRWRPIVNVLDPNDVYVPIITLYDQEGKSYGDGAAWIEHKTGPLAGAKELYVWSSLTADPRLQSQIVSAAIGSVLRRTMPPPAEYVAIRTATPPVIDGKLDDPIWQQAQPVGNFSAIIGGKSGKPVHATQAWMAWDDDNLYVAFKCEQPDVWGRMTKRDAHLWEENVCEVFLDPLGQGKSYKEIEVSPLNTVLDLNIAGAKNGAPLGDTDEAAKWNCEGLRTAVQVDGEVNSGHTRGWTVEMAIPLKSIAPAGSAPPRVGDVWRAQLYRIDRSGARNLKPDDPKAIFEASAWSPTNTFHAPEHFGRLLFGSNALKDDFTAYPAGSDGSPTWMLGAGKWRIEDGKYIGEDSGSNGWIADGAQTGSEAWKDYRLKVNFQVLDVGSDFRDGAWIGFRHHDGDNSYSLDFQAGGITLHKAALGSSTGDTVQLASVPYTRDNAPHAVVITAQGPHITVELDGKQIMDVTDNDFNGTPFVPDGGVVLSARRWAGSTGHTRVAFWGYEVQMLP
jgi:hypothetical protein